MELNEQLHKKAIYLVASCQKEVGRPAWAEGCANTLQNGEMHVLDLMWLFGMWAPGGMITCLIPFS